MRKVTVHLLKLTKMYVCAVKISTNKNLNTIFKNAFQQERRFFDKSNDIYHRKLKLLI
jgi:hypothetical protein